MSPPQPHPHEQEGDLTLGQLLTRSLRSADAILASPSPNDPKLQATLAATLADLSLCDKLIDHLGVLSPNESLDDLSTRNLRCLVVPALEAHLSLLVRTRGGQERLEWLDRAKAHWTRFLDQLDRYGVLDGDDERRRAAIAGPRVGDTDPARRRAGKIAQFKMEREIKATLEELRARRRTTRVRRAADQDDYPSSSEDEDDTTTSVARPLLVNLLTLHALRAYADLDSISHERDILEHGLKLSEIPAPGPHGAAGGRGDGRARAADGEGEGDEDEEDRWRLDVLPGRDGTGPVLSPGGKVLRPFTILPSSSSQLDTRVRLQSEVFRESWRLPTMTIDEYLAGEEAAGRVLQGGGERTTDEVDQARRDDKAEDEEDDTREGYERVERGLAKKREWDDYRDTHRKGEGNMHNRG
ncbi:TAP42-like protein [Rhodotorula diobovata]|uniref:TAP42-like protein n=1 Tax=Rhodotorula diobovata TaxID=5288 RepID=A0A5C5G418_9BASI|nr:TAP42-like protein [Rhodotorula diobovata]